MRNPLVLILSIVLVVCFPFDASAKVPLDQMDIADQKEIRAENQKRQHEYEKYEAELDVERELGKKRASLWKKEQAKLTQEYRKQRSDRLSQIAAEKEKEAVSREKQKQIRAQMAIEESEYNAKLVNRKMEILYGKDDPDGAKEDVVADEEAQDTRPFWEKMFDKKK